MINGRTELNLPSGIFAYHLHKLLENLFLFFLVFVFDSPKVERGSFFSSCSSGGGWALNISISLFAFIAMASSSGIDSLLGLEDSLGPCGDLAVFPPHSAAESGDNFFLRLLVFPCCSPIWKETGFCWKRFRCLMASSDKGSEEARLFLIFCSLSLRWLKRGSDKMRFRSRCWHLLELLGSSIATSARLCCLTAGCFRVLWRTDSWSVSGTWWTEKKRYDKGR